MSDFQIFREQYVQEEKDVTTQDALLCFRIRFPSQGSLSFTNHLQTMIAMDGVAVIWGSSTMMNNLSNSSTIQFDATFKVVLRLFFYHFY